MIERFLIGLLLKNRDGFETATAEGVTSESFEDATCATIFSAMRDVDGEGNAISIPNVCRKLGAAFVADVTAISSESPATLNVKAFAQEVAAQAWIRKAHNALRIASLAISTRRENEPIAPLREAAVEALDLLAEGPKAGAGPQLIRESLRPWIDDLELRVTGKVSANVTSGFKVLDVILNGGWHRGSFVVLAARTGIGKTTFSLSSAVETTLAGGRVLYATTEMSARDMVTKVLSNMARVRTSRYIRGDLDDDEMDRTMGQLTRVAEMPLVIDDSWRGSFDRFAANVARVKRRNGLDAVFLDYIGLCKKAGRYKSRYEEIAEVSMACKRLAIEQDVCLIGLAQLNREAEKVEIPGSEHIADSDSLGRDADAVLLLYRQKVQPTKDEKPTQGEMRAAIVKNRWGITRDIPIAANLAISKFEEVAVNLEAFES